MYFLRCLGARVVVVVVVVEVMMRGVGRPVTLRSGLAVERVCGPDSQIGPCQVCTEVWVNGDRVFVFTASLHDNVK
jgi:hypothetical protein